MPCNPLRLSSVTKVKSTRGPFIQSVAQGIHGRVDLTLRIWRAVTTTNRSPSFNKLYYLFLSKRS
jgi:hypothetical protein